MDPEGESSIEDGGKGLLLLSKAPESYNKTKCIICQTTKIKVSVTTSDAGQKRVREAAEVR